jgi:SAM-dependent methyltransferase
VTFTDPGTHRRRGPVPGPVVCDYRRPVRDWHGWLLDRVDWRPGAVVLDAGSGPGAYVPGVLARVGAGGRVVALDLSLERARAVPYSPRVTRVQGDVTALPFRDGSFDVAMAMHMLYHLADVGLAAAELRRVLRPGGVLLASTNGERDERELVELFVACGGRDPAALGGEGFTLENGGALLAPAFDRVELHDWRDSELVVTDVEAVVNTFESLRYTVEPGLRGDVTWPAFTARLRRAVGDVIRRDGAFRISEHGGVFVCR